MDSIDSLLQLFAQSIHSKFKALNSLDLTSRQKSRLRKSITEDIRTCGGLIFPDILPPEISKAAQQLAEQIGVKICAMNWHDQTSFDKGRVNFQWEHVTTISSIQKLCGDAISAEAIADILRTRLRIAWILKREDKELTRLGYRSKREDPDAAYLHAKIELLKASSSVTTASQ